MRTHRHKRVRTLTIGVVLALASSCGSEPAGIAGTDDPAAARIVTTDIANFWRAFDGSDPASVAAFEREYLAKASPGLREFARKRGVTATALAQMVRARPRYFSSVRESMLTLADDATTQERVRVAYSRMKALYPAAVFPPLTLLVGRFSSGGTIGEEGLMIGSEFFALTGDTPRDELSPFELMNTHQSDSLQIVVAHELVHVQQARAGSLASQGTLLEQALMEGSADFVGQLASGGLINSRIHAWALSHEAEVWADFKDEMNARNVGRWLYNQGTSTEDRPGDLGYFIGYRITEAYFARASDKQAAIRTIIRMRDARALLAASGYDPR